MSLRSMSERKNPLDFLERVEGDWVADVLPAGIHHGPALVGRRACLSDGLCWAAPGSRQCTEGSGGILKKCTIPSKLLKNIVCFVCRLVQFACFWQYSQLLSGSREAAYGVPASKTHEIWLNFAVRKVKYFTSINSYQSSFKQLQVFPCHSSLLRCSFAV